MLRICCVAIDCEHRNREKSPLTHTKHCADIFVALALHVSFVGKGVGTQVLKKNTAASVRLQLHKNAKKMRNESMQVDRRQLEERK